MSPEIIWRGGGPLMVAGLVGGSQKCCCENPPPPYCGCSDYCPYFIEVTAPSYLAVKSPPASCDLGGGFASVSPQSEMQGLGCSPSGWEVADPPNPPFTDYAAAAVSVYGNRLRIGISSSAVREFGTFTKTFPNPYFPSWTTRYFAGGRASASVAVYCDDYSYTEKKYYAIVSLMVYFGIGNDTINVFHKIGKSSVFELPSHCARRPQAHCINTDDDICLLDLPVVVSVSGAGTSLGGWQQEGVEFSTRQQVEDFAGEEVGSYIDCVVDAFSATFRITSRPSCREVPADCDVPIGNGDMTVAIATNPALPVGDPQNDRFILGTATVHQGSGPNNTTIRTEHFGAAAGDSGDPYLFLYQVKNQAGNILQEQYIELFCATDNEVSPPVSRWYVRIGMVCVTDLGTSQTYDEWIGAIASYESPGNYVGINIGDPVPLGSPDLVHDDLYPTSTGTPCEPPAPAQFELSFGGG